MLAKRFLVIALAVPTSACSSGGSEGVPSVGQAGMGIGGALANAAGMGGASAVGGMAGASAIGGMAGAMGDDALIVPAWVTVTALAGGNGVLDVLALTLRKGPSSTELYAALRNDGDIPACAAGFSVELFDKAEQSLAAGISALLTTHLYRLTDGSGTITSCVGPGDVTMAAVTGLPSLVLDDVGHVVYQCPYFALDVAPIDGFTASQVKAIAGGAGTTYAGTFVNGLDVPVINPSVTVFPVNRVGRPLGAVVGSSTSEIPPGGSWDFETSPVDTPGADFVAYPTAGLKPP